MPFRQIIWFGGKWHFIGVVVFHRVAIYTIKTYHTSHILLQTKKHLILFQICCRN